MIVILFHGRRPKVLVDRNIRIVLQLDKRVGWRSRVKAGGDFPIGAVGVGGVLE